MVRMGTITHAISYVVDLNNPEMVNYAKGAIIQDITELVIQCGSEEILEALTVREDATLTQSDIPAFIREAVDTGDIGEYGDLVPESTTEEQGSQRRVVRCIIAALNGNGEPDLFFVKVECSEAQYNDGAHYEAAKKAAAADGYEPRMAFDESDSGGKAMLPLFTWETATLVTI